MRDAAYVYVLAVESGHVVECALGASYSPIESAIELLDSRSRPAVLAYSRFGTLRRAIVAKLDLRDALERWHLRKCWFRVPVPEGPEFRSCIKQTLGRYERGGVPVEMHHIDMYEYFASRRRASMAVRRRFTASPGALKSRA